MTIVAGDDGYKPEEDNQPVPLTQAGLNDLSQDLNLSKESAQLLVSCLKEKHLLASGTMFYWYWDCKREFRQFFTFPYNPSLVYCNNIAGLIKSMGLEYDATEWRLFIDSSSWSLKAVLHNGNSFSSISFGHSVKMKETHNSMDHLLSAINYQEHKWLICRDFKVVGLVQGLKGWCTKYLSFLCLWDSQANDQHYVRQEWLSRQGFKPDLHNV